MEEVDSIGFDYEKYSAWKRGRDNKIAKLNPEWGVPGWSVFKYLSDIFHCNKNKPIRRESNHDIRHLWRPDILERFIDDCVKYELLCTDGVNIWLPGDIVNPFYIADGKFLNKNYEHTHGE